MSASSTIRSRYSAVSWRRVGLATTCGPGARRACPVPALGLSSLRSSPPGAGAPASIHVMGSLSALIAVHLRGPHSFQGYPVLNDVGREGGGPREAACSARKVVAQGTARTDVPVALSRRWREPRSWRLRSVSRALFLDRIARSPSRLGRMMLPPILRQPTHPR